MLTGYFTSYNVERRINCEQLVCNEMRLKMLRIFLMVFLFVGLQACFVSGPVHFYSGHRLSKSETARLSVPGPITVTMIDGKEVDVPSINDGFYEIFLLPGPHRISFMFEQDWGGSLDGFLIKSDVVGVDSQFISGMNYELTYPVPENADEAFDMSAMFKARLVEKETGRHVESRSIDELNALKALAPVTQNNEETKVKPAPSAVSSSVTVPSDINADSAVAKDAVKRMKFWWLIANEDERKRFKQWMKSTEGVE